MFFLFERWINEDISNIEVVESEVNTDSERQNYICASITINAPDNYYLTHPLPEISGLNYAHVFTHNDYASPALQDAFISFFNLTDDDIFIVFTETPSQVFINATNGLNPVMIKFNDVASNGSYTWIDGLPASSTPISQSDLTDVFLTARQTINDTISNDSSINGIDKLQIYVDRGQCSTEVVFEFSVWYN